MERTRFRRRRISTKKWFTWPKGEVRISRIKLASHSKTRCLSQQVARLKDQRLSKPMAQVEVTQSSSPTLTQIREKTWTHHLIQITPLPLKSRSKSSLMRIHLVTFARKFKIFQLLMTTRNSKLILRAKMKSLLWLVKTSRTWPLRRDQIREWTLKIWRRYNTSKAHERDQNCQRRVPSLQTVLKVKMMALLLSPLRKEKGKLTSLTHLSQAAYLPIFSLTRELLLRKTT